MERVERDDNDDRISLRLLWGALEASKRERSMAAAVTASGGSVDLELGLSRGTALRLGDNGCGEWSGKLGLRLGSVAMSPFGVDWPSGLGTRTRGVDAVC